MRRSSPLCLLVLLGCGPVAIGGDPGDQPTVGAPLPDGGVVLAPDAGAQPADAGAASGSPQNPPAQVMRARNLKVDGVRATTLYARSIKSKSMRCDRLVTVSESDLPEPGNQDVHGGVVAAGELHARDVDAAFVEGGTCYASKIDTK
jgi:hypothetical protein